jgi:FkbM family methyltransferase
MKTLVKNIIKSIFYNKGVKRSISGIDIVLPYGFHNYYEPDYEAENFNFFRKNVKKNDVVIDIGAQLGLLTKLFSDLTGTNGRVHCFEPTPSTFKLLNESIALNNLFNVTSNQTAVCDITGMANILISSIKADAGNTLSKDDSVNRKGVLTEAVSIDDYLKKKEIPKIDFVKIDAEGAEFLVLKGMKNALENSRPIINLALHPKTIKNMGHSLDLIYDLLKENNYSIIYLNKAMEKADFCGRTNLFDVHVIPDK